MRKLRDRMVEEMQLRRFAAQKATGTQESYVQAVTKLVKYMGKSPEEITAEEMRQYFLYLTNEKELARSSVMQAICGLKFFYEAVLKRAQWAPGEVYDIQWPRREKKLPVVLSMEEVHKVHGQVQQPSHRVCFTTIYSCGLRVYVTLPVFQFIGRFLQHVLPQGFVKVRYDGFYAPSHRHRLALARELLDADHRRPHQTQATAPVTTSDDDKVTTLSCPKCGQPMRCVQINHPAAQPLSSLARLPWLDGALHLKHPFHPGASPAPGFGAPCSMSISLLPCITMPFLTHINRKFAKF